MYLKCLILLFILNFIDAQHMSYRRYDTPCHPPHIDHGRIRLRQRNRFIEFKCFPRYTLVGNKYATCRGGAWDVPKPVCVKSGCKPYPEIKNGISISSYNDSWMHYFCLPGLTLVGSPVIYCDGQDWNSTLPTCIDSKAKTETSCDFEDPGLCGWTQDVLHDFDWRRFNKKTPSSFLSTGPTYDHTYGINGQGYFMYIESTARVVNDSARLISPVYDAEVTKDGCFRFFYHMYGSSTGGLRVYQKRDSVSMYQLLHMDDEDKEKYLLFEKWGDQGNQWFQNLSNLSPLTEDFQIVIEGIRGKSYTSDIAIDDVALLRGQNCTAIPETTTIRNDDAFLESCSGRCSESSGRVRPGICQCNLECVINYNCCPDFFEVCEFDCIGSGCSNDTTATSSSDERPQTQKLIATTTSTIKPATATTQATTSTSPLTIPTTTSTTNKPISPTASTPHQTTTTPSITRKPSTTSTTAKITTAEMTTMTPRTTTRSTTKIATTKPTTTKVPTTKRLTTRLPGTKSPTTKLTTTTSTSSPKIMNTTQITEPATTGTGVKISTPRATTKPTTETLITRRNTIGFTSTTQGTTKTRAQQKAADGPSGAKVGIIVGVVGLVCCAAVWAVFVLMRGAGGTVTLARLRGRLSSESEVRYLKSDDDED